MALQKMLPLQARGIVLSENLGRTCLHSRGSDWEYVHATSTGRVKETAIPAASNTMEESEATFSGACSHLLIKLNCHTNRREARS